MPPPTIWGVAQLAMLASWSTWKAPSTTAPSLPERAISKEVTLSKNEAPGFRPTNSPLAL